MSTETSTRTEVAPQTGDEDQDIHLVCCAIRERHFATPEIARGVLRALCGSDMSRHTWLRGEEFDPERHLPTCTLCLEMGIEISYGLVPCPGNGGRPCRGLPGGVDR